MGNKAPRCSDCSFFRDDAAFLQCWHDRLVIWNPVYGNQPSDARKQRDGGMGICGPDATLFEKRQPGSLEKILIGLLSPLVGAINKPEST